MDTYLKVSVSFLKHIYYKISRRDEMCNETQNSTALSENSPNTARSRPILALANSSPWTDYAMYGITNRTNLSPLAV